jgi:hypothetical protein
MSGGWPARFAEWNSMNANGKAIDLSGRKTTFADTHENNPRLTADEAAQYSDMSRMFGDWQPTMQTEQAPIPTNLTATGSTLTWDDSRYALLWAVCCDDHVVDFTTTPTYTVTKAGTYTIRAANEMGGLSQASVAVKVGDQTGLTNVPVGASAELSKYNLRGQRVDGSYRGIVVSGGRKVVVK